MSRAVSMPPRKTASTWIPPLNTPTVQGNKTRFLPLAHIRVPNTISIRELLGPLSRGHIEELSLEAEGVEMVEN